MDIVSVAITCAINILENHGYTREEAYKLLIKRILRIKENYMDQVKENENMSKNLETAKEIIKKNLGDAVCGIFDSRNIDG